MTEKTLLVDNPFSLEVNPKKVNSIIKIEYEYNQIPRKC